MVVLSIKVIPKSSKDAIIGWEGDYLKIKINAVPEKGEVNRCLINFLSKTFEIPKSKIHLIQGKTHRLKQLQFEGISKKELLAKINSLV